MGKLEKENIDHEICFTHDNFFLRANKISGESDSIKGYFVSEPGSLLREESSFFYSEYFVYLFLL